MLKFFKYSAFYLAIAIGCTMFSCQQDDPAEEITQEKNALTHDDLVAIMAEDELVQQFILNNTNFLNQFDEWYGALSLEERKEYMKASKEALRNGRELEKEFISPEQVREHYKKQQELADDIKAKFPELYMMGKEKQDAIRQDVSAKILGKSIGSDTKGKGVGSNYSLSPDPCHMAYNDCSWYCYDHDGGDVCYDACWAGYVTCKGLADEDSN